MSENPVISVIIHFLNSEKYLSKAIESVLKQTFTDWELVFVDGGSSDNSFNIAKHYQDKLPKRVRIFKYKGNGTLGIFSSRVWGAKEARSPILALLDSDDEWHPQFLERHYAIYKLFFGSTKGMIFCPMVYWREDPVFAAKSFVQVTPRPGMHYPPTLLLDFIRNGYKMSAGNSSVMIDKEIVIEAESLIGMAAEKTGDDQFLWSFIILKYPIFISSEPLVRYRLWSGSTCATTNRIRTIYIRIRHLEWLLGYIKNNYRGISKERLVREVAKELIQARTIIGESIKISNILIWWGKLSNSIRGRAKRIIAILYKFFKVFTRLAFLGGIKPFSYRWGSDRGLPIHRYYLSHFLKEFSNDIKGNCLEFGEDTYILTFGGDKVRSIDILHINDQNPKATIVGDLTKPNAIPSNKFDCIICTHVLHLVLEFDKFVSDLYRILKPGGVLLLAVPHISMCDPDIHEFWRFTPEGLKLLLTKMFPEEHIETRAYGNSLTAAGEIRGLVSYEFTPLELDTHDEKFCVEVCARVVKPSIKV